MSYKIAKTGEQIEEILNRADKALDGYVLGAPDILTQAKNYTDSFGAEAIREIKEQTAESLEDILSVAQSVIASIPEDYTELINSEKIINDRQNARLANLEAAAQGKLYREQVDDSAAYVKPVPAGALPYAAVTTIGGKTMMWNQLVSMPNRSGGGIVYTKISDGVYSIVGTSTSTNSSRFPLCTPENFVQYHKYFVSLTNISGTPLTSGVFTIMERKASGTIVRHFYNSTIFTESEPSAGLYIRVVFENTVESVYRISVHDLTAIYGDGNEPTTTSDPRIAELERIAEARPQYDPGSEITAEATNIISKDADGNTIDEQGAIVPVYVEVVPGGSITFDSETTMDVPSSVTYAINVQEAIANE